MKAKEIAIAMILVTVGTVGGLVFIGLTNKAFDNLEKAILSQYEKPEYELNEGAKKIFKELNELGSEFTNKQ